MRCNILTLLEQHFIKSFVSRDDFQTVVGGIELFLCCTVTAYLNSTLCLVCHETENVVKK